MYTIPPDPGTVYTVPAGAVYTFPGELPRDLATLPTFSFHPFFLCVFYAVGVESQESGGGF